MSLQFLSAALPNLLLFFIFIVSVVSLLSCKLIQRGLMLELAPYADSKPLSTNKVYHVRLSLIPRIFIYLAWRGKQREMDGIMVISFLLLFFFYFTSIWAQSKTFGKFIICLLLMYMYFIFLFIYLFIMVGFCASKHLKYPDIEQHTLTFSYFLMITCVENKTLFSSPAERNIYCTSYSCHGAPATEVGRGATAT